MKEKKPNEKNKINEENEKETKIIQENETKIIQENGKINQKMKKKLK